MDKRRESFLLNTDNFLVFFVFEWGKNQKLITEISDLQK